MVQLRPQGIYLLPDGRRYVFVKTDLGFLHLYRERLILDDEPRYRVGSRGEVLDPVTLKVVFPAGRMVDTGDDYQRLL